MTHPVATTALFAATELLDQALVQLEEARAGVIYTAHLAVIGQAVAAVNIGRKLADCAGKPPVEWTP